MLNKSITSVLKIVKNKRFVQFLGMLQKFVLDKHVQIVAWFLFSIRMYVPGTLFFVKEGALDIGFDDKALLIRSLAVNPLEQGKGFAFQAMNILPEFVNKHYPEVNKLVLIVNAKNMPAQKLYQKAGFVEHSSRLHEIHGVQLIYRYDL